MPSARRMAAAVASAGVMPVAVCCCRTIVAMSSLNLAPLYRARMVMGSLNLAPFYETVVGMCLMILATVYGTVMGVKPLGL